MQTNRRQQLNVLAGQSFEALARIVGWNDTPIVPDDLDAVSMTIYSVNEAEESVEALAEYEDVPITPENCVSPTLLVNTKWDEDATGYNFHHITPNVFSNRGEIYEVRYTLTPSNINESEIVVSWQVKVK